MDLENAGEGGTEIRSPSWSYLEGSAEEMTSRNLPHAAPVVIKIRMGKLCRALCAELFASQGGEKVRPLSFSRCIFLLRPAESII